MFKALKRLGQNAKKLKSKVLFQIVFSDDSVQDLVLDLNVFDQLFKEGELSDGNLLPTYSTSTAMYNQGGSFNFTSSQGESFSRKKTQNDPIFLLDKGDFYKSFRVKVLDDGFTIQADTIKEDGTDLSKKYGKILGLTDESKAKLVQKILPMVIQETRKAIIG